MLRPRSTTEAQHAALTRRSRVLWQELRTATDRAQDPKVRAWREAQGFTRTAAAMGFGGGVARVIPESGGTYRPAETDEPGSLPAILFYVWEGQAPGRPETLLDLAAWVPQQRRVAALAGIVPDGGHLASSLPSGDILDHLRDRGDITPRQVDAARWFRAAAGGLSFPGLRPCRSMWKAPLLSAWGALEDADAIITHHHHGCPPASFTVWRIVIEKDRPGWLSPEADPELARLERLALWTGLEALAAVPRP